MTDRPSKWANEHDDDYNDNDHNHYEDVGELYEWTNKYLQNATIASVI